MTEEDKKTMESLQKLYKKIETANERRERRRKINFLMGCMFLVTSAIFTILSFILKKPEVMYGVVAQLFAAILLISANKK
jgi:hypothetical protein